MITNPELAVGISQTTHLQIQKGTGDQGTQNKVSNVFNSALEKFEDISLTSQANFETAPLETTDEEGSNHFRHTTIYSLADVKGENIKAFLNHGNSQGIEGNPNIDVRVTDSDLESVDNEIPAVIDITDKGLEDLANMSDLSDNSSDADSIQDFEEALWPNTRHITFSNTETEGTSPEAPDGDSQVLQNQRNTVTSIYNEIIYLDNSSRSVSIKF